MVHEGETAWLLLPLSYHKEDAQLALEQQLMDLGLSLAQGQSIQCADKGMAMALENRDKSRPRGQLMRQLLPLLRSNGIALYVGSAHNRADIRYIVSDLDGTLISCEVMVLLARLMGLELEMFQLTQQAMMGIEGFRENFVRRTKMLSGLRLSEILEVVAEIPLSQSVLDWRAELSTEGIALEVASGAYSLIVEGVCRRMDIRHYCASVVEVVEEKLTGRLHHIVSSEEKATFIRSRMQVMGLARAEVMVVGDGANDLLMLEEGDHALLYQARMEQESFSLSDAWAILGALCRGDAM